MIDFRQDTNGDIDLSKGDVHYVESTVAHQRDLMLTCVGSLKHSPLTGAGIIDFIQDEDPEGLLRMIRRKFIYDGMTVNSVELTDAGEVETDAYYDVYPVVPHFANPLSGGFPMVFPFVLAHGENEAPWTFPILLGGNTEFDYTFDIELK